MKTVWSAKSECERCEWTGRTVQHKLVIASGLLYLAVFLAAVVADGAELFHISDYFTWPVAVVALAWWYGVPALLWRANRCPRCRHALPPAVG